MKNEKYNETTFGMKRRQKIQEKCFRKGNVLYLAYFIGVEGLLS